MRIYFTSYSDHEVIAQNAEYNVSFKSQLSLQLNASSNDRRNIHVGRVHVDLNSRGSVVRYAKRTKLRCLHLYSTRRIRDNTRSFLRQTNRTTMRWRSAILFAKIASGHESVDVACAITFVVNTSKISADDVIRVCRCRRAYSVWIL